MYLSYTINSFNMENLLVVSVAVHFYLPGPLKKHLQRNNMIFKRDIHSW